jgi:hypothetical protein
VNLVGDSQIEAIKNLNSLIRKTQGIMDTTKKSYEAAVQARNATGEGSTSTGGHGFASAAQGAVAVGLGQSALLADPCCTSLGCKCAGTV